MRRVDVCGALTFTCRSLAPSMAVFGGGVSKEVNMVR